MIEKINNLVKEGKIKEARINRSVKRIINLKQKYEVFDETVEKTLNIEEINKEIQRIRDKCGFPI